MIQRSRLLSKMRAHELFASVAPDVLWAAMEGESAVCAFRRGDRFSCVEDGEPVCAFLLSGGALRCGVQTEPGFERFGCGRLVGVERLFVTADASRLQLEATTQTQVLFLKKAFFLRLLQADHTFSLSMIRYLSTRVGSLERRVTTYTGGSAQSRLARYLLDAFGDYKTFELDRSMQQLALLLNISRPSLYRAFSHLQNVGAIGREGKSFRLANRERLIQCIFHE